MALALVAAAAGCGDDTDAAGGSPGPSRTWSIPDSLCADLGLTGIVGAAATDGATSQTLGSDVDPDRAVCAAGAGELSVEVTARVSSDAAQHRRDWSTAQRRAQPSSVWQAAGPLATASPQPAPWGSRSTSVRFTSTQRSSDERADAVRVMRVDSVDDDNLVATVLVTTASAGGAGASEAAVDQVTEATLDALPDALEKR